MLVVILSHSSADKTKPNGKKTMSEKSKSKSSDATFQPSAPNQFSSSPVDGMGKGGVIKTGGS